MNFNRRKFLVNTGWLAGGITVLSACSLIPATPTGLGELKDALGWIKLNEEGQLLFYCPRSEMGQGIDTGLSQIIAEELWLSPEHIQCILPSTAQIAPVQSTVGSQSMQNYLQPMAIAAATLREHLRVLAAHQTGQKLAALQLVEGGFQSERGGTQAYRQIVKLHKKELIISRLLEPQPELRCLSFNHYVGKVSAMKGADAIVRGQALYARDATLPGTLFGAVVKPPYLHAQLESYEATTALQIDHVVTVVMGPDSYPGVVAETPMALRQALAALNCQWAPLRAQQQEYIHPQLDIDQAIRNGDIDHSVVDIAAPSNEPTVSTLSLRFDTPMLAHAAMEPRAGLAQVINGKCELWGASQDPFFMQQSIAKMLELNPRQVIVHNHRLGGGFGGRLLCQAGIEAAWLASKVSQPVKVQWSREDEFCYNYVGPQFSHRINITFDKANKIHHWQHRFTASPIMISSVFIPKLAYPVVDLIADKGVSRGATPAYAFASQRVEFGSTRTGMPTGAWRGLGAAPNTFAVERAMDEAAKSVNIDPIQFRLNHCTDPRYIAVIKRARQLSNWTQVKNTTPQKNVALGFAATVYKDQTFVAIVAQTSRLGERFKVDKLWCVHDCGRVISPDRVQAQIEGNLCWGVSMALVEKFTLNRGIATSNNFDSYPIAGQKHMPLMIIEMVESSESVSGAGEAAFAPAAAAIVNSLSILTETAINTLPLSKLA